MWQEKTATTRQAGADKHLVKVFITLSLWSAREND